MVYPLRPRARTSLGRAPSPPPSRAEPHLAGRLLLSTPLHPQRAVHRLRRRQRLDHPHDLRLLRPVRLWERRLPGARPDRRRRQARCQGHRHLSRPPPRLRDPRGGVSKASGGEDRLLHFGEEPPRWSKDVKFILADISKEEIELRKQYLGHVGDAKMVVDLINKEIEDDPYCLGKLHPWVEAISKKSKDNAAWMEAQPSKDVFPFNFFTPMRIIRDAILSEGSLTPIVVSEGANTMDVGR